jgi:uncharacterized membrane protein YcaP (DUF421 family)
MLLLGKVFDWHSILFGKENWSYLPQAALKTIFMFIVVLLSLRLIGRRGIMQGIFQVLTIIMLGSSAGDPMLYSEVGLLPATAVFLMIVVLYRIADFIVAKYSRLERLTEGDTIRLIKGNRFEIENFGGEELSKDEIFADLRMEGVSHLGQVNVAYMEAGGQISVFYYSDDQVKYGLPILPERYDKQLIEIKERGIYSCAYCGFTEELPMTKDHECPICNKYKWVQSINERRVT